MCHFKAHQSRLWAGASILAAFVGLAGVSCSKPVVEGGKRVELAEVPVSVAQVQMVRADRTVPIVGTLFPKDEATVAAEVEGKAEKTTVDFGDRITVGQELARIDTTTYAALANQAAANLEKARAAATNAARTLSRVQELRKSGIASSSDLDQASAVAQETDAEVRAVLAAEAVARLNVERSRVKAPFAAAIADRVVSAGDFVKTGTPLFRVVNDLQLKFITSVPERYSAQIKKGQLADFTVDAWPGEVFHGNVLLISPSVNTKTRALTFGILVQNADLKLKANSYARGELILERDAPTLQVPLDAVVNFSGLTKVFVVDSGVARVREVQVGKIINGRQEILAGLKEGETVVLSGHSKLHEGAKVAVKPATADPAPQPASN